MDIQPFTILLFGFMAIIVTLIVQQHDEAAARFFMQGMHAGLHIFQVNAR